MSIVAAVARTRVIGVNNRLPRHLTADLRRFRALNLGKPVVTRRRMHQSIGKPLAGRRNIVISRHGEVMEGCERAASFEEAPSLAAYADETMVIGGMRCYRDALDLAARMYPTETDVERGDDARIPQLTSNACSPAVSLLRCSLDGVPGGARGCLRNAHDARLPCLCPYGRPSRRGSIIKTIVEAVHARVASTSADHVADRKAVLESELLLGVRYTSKRHLVDT